MNKNAQYTVIVGVKNTSLLSYSHNDLRGFLTTYFDVFGLNKNRVIQTTSDLERKTNKLNEKLNNALIQLSEARVAKKRLALKLVQYKKKIN